MDSEMVDAAAMGVEGEEVFHDAATLGVEEEELSHIAAVQEIIRYGAWTIQTMRQIDHLVERVSPLTQRKVELLAHMIIACRQTDIQLDQITSAWLTTFEVVAQRQAESAHRIQNFQQRQTESAHERLDVQLPQVAFGCAGEYNLPDGIPFEDDELDMDHMAQDMSDLPSEDDGLAIGYDSISDSGIDRSTAGHVYPSDDDQDPQPRRRHTGQGRRGSC